MPMPLSSEKPFNLDHVALDGSNPNLAKGYDSHATTLLIIDYVAS